MPVSDAQKRANKKYNQTKIDTIYLRIPRGSKETIKSHAATVGESVNEFVWRAINETMDRDRKK